MELRCCESKQNGIKTKLTLILISFSLWLVHYEKEETSNNLYRQLAHFHQWKIQRDQRHKYNDPDVKYSSELLKSSKCVFLLLLTTTTTMGCCPCSPDPPHPLTSLLVKRAAAPPAQACLLARTNRSNHWSGTKLCSSSFSYLLPHPTPESYSSAGLSALRSRFYGVLSNLGSHSSLNI